MQEEKLIGAGIATIALAGAAFGIGDCFKQLFGYAILGFALTEAIASFAPMMAFLILSVVVWLRFKSTDSALRNPSLVSAAIIIFATNSQMPNIALSEPCH